MLIKSKTRLVALSTTAFLLKINTAHATENTTFTSVWAKNGKWLLMSDIVIAKLSDSKSFNSLNQNSINASVKQTIVSGFVDYEPQPFGIFKTKRLNPAPYRIQSFH